MAKDYLKTAILAFIAQAVQFNTWFQANWSRFNMFTAAQAAALAALVAVVQAAVTAKDAANAAYRSAVAVADAKVQELRDMIRELVQRLRTHPDFTEADAVAAGIAITAAGGVADPDRPPQLLLESTPDGKGVIAHWGETPGNELINKRREDAIGAWLQIVVLGPNDPVPPVDSPLWSDATLENNGRDTDSSFEIRPPAGLTGPMRVAVRVCYIGARMRKISGWSDPAFGTLTP